MQPRSLEYFEQLTATSKNHEIRKNMSMGIDRGMGCIKVITLKVEMIGSSLRRTA